MSSQRAEVTVFKYSCVLRRNQQYATKSSPDYLLSQTMEFINEEEPTGILNYKSRSESYIIKA